MTTSDSVHWKITILNLILVTFINCENKFCADVVDLNNVDQ